ncbi:hypothetical protein B0J13DRAFT_568623 [Dactylonectria estremocensis]|uniref:Nitrogen regulatory protein areA GATA-like domain-containing protein n=1 Tax=Dactylonectria estremocensis TaxID=1079267 RepID=A0A9P9DJN5_9HYPO|nr:hypothetical protein B0J13DRAFT_568623 [Dactylonectria estremocensis]
MTRTNFSSFSIANAESMDLPYSSTYASDLSIISDEGKKIRSAGPSNGRYSLSPFPKDGCFRPPGDSLEPPPNPKTGNSYTVSPAGHGIPVNKSRSEKSELPELLEHAEDDSATKANPWRHVDYLSHDWKEEDIWSSWKYITTRRREYLNSSRLENASWRAWIKCKYKLKTVSPETLNWFKDCDVTWLYGPLQQDPSKICCADAELSSISPSKSNSQVSIDKKSILKRTVPEIMLRRPLSPSSLLKQTASVVRAQETNCQGLTRHTLDRAAVTGYVISSRRMSRNASSILSSSASEVSSPGIERKHIRFNDKVEQCIIVNGHSDDDNGINSDPYSHSDSDDGLRMKRLRQRKQAPLVRRKSTNDENSFVSNGKTLAMLPPTTLNHRGDILDPTEEAIKHSISIRNPTVSPALPPETCPKLLGRFFEEEENHDMTDVDVVADSAWYGAKSFENSSLYRRTSTDSITAEPTGRRRTLSGMFMPYEEGESSSKDAIFGRFIDIVNIARDMAYFIRNVGWRK